ncbi:MAG: M48 family metallopeptidase [Gammaproteobacteria bacterium]|nr:MAG: M48 family peptidase [Gammaproteobacteria bacterium]UCH40223.1 MAG: M48 family metallopeptidase [Gammaproteobacteria bacterium]
MKNDRTDRADELEWKLRVSPRARYARLLIKPYGGLEVVVPPRFPRGEIPFLVAKHADWARLQLDRQAKLVQSIRLPQHLSLAFDNSTTPVVYASQPLVFNYDLFAEQSRQRIVIEASTQREQIRELRNWIRRRAQELFPALLEELSRRTGLEFRKVTIRSQKTRWGSCSARGHISLNDQLLFLPAKTVEYLMIHELCHTRFLNHSRDYWRLVEHHCPDYRDHEKLLSLSRNLVPDWFLLDLYR